MFNFQAHIIDNGGKSRMYSFATTDNSFQRAAQTITENAHVQNGGHVTFALMTFDRPTHQFKVMAYQFDVIDGNVENLNQA